MFATISPEDRETAGLVMAVVCGIILYGTVGAIYYVEWNQRYMGKYRDSNLNWLSVGLFWPLHLLGAIFVAIFNLFGLIREMWNEK